MSAIEASPQTDLYALGGGRHDFPGSCPHSQTRSGRGFPDPPRMEHPGSEGRDLTLAPPSGPLPTTTTEVVVVGYHLSRGEREARGGLLASLWPGTTWQCLPGHHPRHELGVNARVAWSSHDL